MNYKQTLNEAVRADMLNEKNMMNVLYKMADIMDLADETYPEEHLATMREIHECIYGPHYDYKFAMHDICNLEYENREGEIVTGAKWSMEEVVAKTKDVKFPANTTVWDIYVAVNRWYAEMCRVLNDDDIILIATKFWFSEEGKIWNCAK